MSCTDRTQADQTEGHHGLTFNTRLGVCMCVCVNKNLKVSSDLTYWFSRLKKNMKDKNMWFWWQITLPLSKDSSLPSEWRSIRASRSLSQWLQQLSGCKLRPSRSWSSISWCSRFFPPESTCPPPTRPLLLAERAPRYQLNSVQMFISTTHHHDAKQGDASSQEMHNEITFYNPMHINKRG